MSDLIKRLRATSLHLGQLPPPKLCHEAADEIERLRAELEKEKRAYRTAIKMPFMRSTPKGWKYDKEED